jgi:sortase (surface protein transpeptidase)
VIDGHIDSAATGPGAFFQLADLRIGDLLIVTTTTGDRRTYPVTGRRTYHKADGLPPDLFATTGPPRLVLITCGGSFDRSTGSYSDNIVVFAAPT